MFRSRLHFEPVQSATPPGLTTSSDTTAFGPSSESVASRDAYIRPTAVRKKNWLFVGDAGTGQRGAVIYTIIESCRRRGIDPLTYLREVLNQLPSMTNRQIPTLTPEAWRKGRIQRAA